MNRIVFIAIALANFDLALANNLPKLSERVYFIGKDTHSSPVVIRPDIGQNSEQRFILRDPIQPGYQDSVILSREKEGVESKRVKLHPRIQEAKIVFNTKEIHGKISRPRVSFEQKLVPLNNVDESFRINYLKKVFESADLDIDL